MRIPPDIKTMALPSGDGIREALRYPAEPVREREIPLVTKALGHPRPDPVLESRRDRNPTAPAKCVVVKFCYPL
jgi:hypothetical protein